MDWVENINSRPGTGESGGAKTDERYFTVWGATGRACIDSPSTIINLAGQSLPGYRSAHPANSALKLDRYSASTNGVVVNMTATYSNDGRFGSATVPAKPVMNEPAIFAASFRRSEAMIPYARRAVIRYATAEGEDSGEVNAWELSEVRDDTEMLIVEYEATFPANQFAAGTEAIRQQARKIHKLGDKYYRFQGGNVRANSDGTYTCTYAWEYDPGVLSSTSYSPGTAVIRFPSSLVVGLFPGVEWVRPPFHIVVPYRDSTDATVAPLFDAVQQGDVDMNGWQTLPGMNL